MQNNTYTYSTFLFLLKVLSTLVITTLHIESTVSQSDSTFINNEQLSIHSDSTIVSHMESLENESIDNDTTEQSHSIIDAEVTYSASDSIIVSPGTKKYYLYGNSSVQYKDINLTAAFIELDLDSSLAYAYGFVDTLGVEQGLPIFSDKSGEYTMRTIKYNFNSKKAIIEHVVTEQGEGFIVSERAKKSEDNTYCITNGRYSTCANHDHPHFYLNMTKAKVIPGKKIITGPAYLVIEDIPIYFIGIPLGFVPSSKSYSSGVIIPSYGEESSRGFFLRQGGYYWAANDYFDLRTTGDIYTNGSWGVQSMSKYKKRYKFSGNFNARYITNISSEKDLPDYSKSKDFAINWSHRQDPKANPFQTFSASVNYSTSSFDKNNVTSVINPTQLATNSKQSSVSLQKRWPGNSPFNLSLSLRHSQNSRDSTISLTLPDVTLTMKRLFPFKSENAIGSKEKWYEKIGVSYSSSARNFINTKENDLSFSGQSLIEEWQNGIKHSIPVSMNLKFLKYFTLTPNVNYSERWYLTTTDKEKVYIEDENGNRKLTEITTVSNEFSRAYDYRGGVSTSTKLYTFYKPSRLLFGDKIDAIRHVITPNVGLSYSPNFGDEKYGYYDNKEYFDETIQEMVPYYYSRFGSNPIYGTPGRSESGSLSIGVGNTLEMKVKSDKDTTGFKKIAIIESLNFSTSHNFLADSLKWSKISMSGRTKIFGTNINFGATFDPYALDTNSLGKPIRINKSEFKVNKNLARMESANLGFGYSISSDKLKKRKDELAKAEEDLEELDPSMTPEDPFNPEGESLIQSQETEAQTVNETGYVDFSIPWNLSFNYSLRLANDKFDKDKMAFNKKITQSLNFSGGITLTQKWKLSFSSGYDFTEKKLTHTNFRVSRNLHCWSMNFNMVPIGRYKSFFFSINVNSSMLKDLKYEKRNSPRDNSSYY